MPIVYQPAAPVGFAGGAGQAEAMERNLPTLAAAYGHAAQLAQQQAESGQRVQLANAARMQDDRQFQDRIIADRNAQGANLVAGAEHQQGVANMQMAGFLAEQQRQERGAQLESWLNQQKLSQHEKMLKQEMQNKIGVVKKAVAEGVLDQEHGNDLMMQIATHLSPLQQREQQEHVKAQTELFQQQTQMAKAKAEDEALMAQIRTKSLAGQSSFEPDKGAVEALQKEFRDLGRVPMPNPLDPQGSLMAMAKFQSDVAAEAEKRGLGHYYVPGPKGEKLPDPYKMEEMKRRIGADGVRADEAKAHEERIAKRSAEISALAQKWEEGVIKETGKVPTAEARRAHVDELLGITKKIEEAVRGSQPGEQAKAASGQLQQRSLDATEEHMKKLTDRGDLSPQAKVAGTHLLGEIARLVREYPPGKSKEMERHIEDLWGRYNQMVPPPPAPPDPKKLFPGVFGSMAASEKPPVSVAPFVTSRGGGY